MNPEIKETICTHIKSFLGKDNIEILGLQPGYIYLHAIVPDSGFNIYGGIHGGYLFTLCDTAAGMSAYAYGISNVTQNGNITYLRGTTSKDLFIEAKTLHKGRRVIVSEVTIKDDQDHLLVTSNFSLFVTGTLN